MAVIKLNVSQSPLISHHYLFKNFTDKNIVLFSENIS